MGLTNAWKIAHGLGVFVKFKNHCSRLSIVMML